MGPPLTASLHPPEQLWRSYTEVSTQGNNSASRPPPFPNLTIPLTIPETPRGESPLPVIVLYGLPVLFGVLALSAGLVLASAPSLAGFDSPTPGAIMFIVGALITAFSLLLSLRPRR